MIVSGVNPDDTPKLFTRVYWKDRYILVGITEEELFRKVLGDEVFEQRCDAEYYKLEGSDRPDTDASFPSLTGPATTPPKVWEFWK